MPEIRLRSEMHNTDAHAVGEVPLTEEALDEAMRVVRAWGVTIDGEYADTENMFGQFVITDGRAYFEIVEGS